MVAPRHLVRATLRRADDCCDLHPDCARHEVPSALESWIVSGRCPVVAAGSAVCPGICFLARRPYSLIDSELEPAARRDRTKAGASTGKAVSDRPLRCQSQCSLRMGV